MKINNNGLIACSLFRWVSKQVSMFRDSNIRDPIHLKRLRALAPGEKNQGTRVYYRGFTVFRLVQSVFSLGIKSTNSYTCPIALIQRAPSDRITCNKPNMGYAIWASVPTKRFFSVGHFASLNCAHYLPRE